MPFQMSEAYQNLGQQFPNAGVLTDLAIVPTGTQYMVATVMVCNQSSSQEFVRLSWAVNGAADARGQYLVYDAPFFPNESKGFTLGITMAAGDKLRCQSRTGLVSFNASGSAIT